MRFQQAAIVYSRSHLRRSDADYDRADEAQRAYEPLFDKFNFKAELSWVGLNTTVGLYSVELDQGAALKFEDDLNLGNQENIPSLDFEWQIAKRHRLAARWQVDQPEFSLPEPDRDRLGG